ncbi:DNA-binding NtrC family response regulator [Microbacterium sp. SORGH_AS 505]|uniref:hypothetical protein n=1 Tax=Microbacterium sp. SORGH_AS_0505 TaxID=3041770 RepID=UPI00278AD539|nr:hypothetical protein [Microbacterium sp. SORGH_AS_0505]MDQ1126236.1 DNA-binding NtrC family response regulator [Microbacterium sp. SORGH_AS_0505]
MTASTAPGPDEPHLQVDEVERIDLADKLDELSEQLHRAAELMHNRERSTQLHERALHGDDPDEYELLMLDAKSSDEFRRALTALRDFRRQYGHWERVIAEYTLQKMNYTQRDAAKYLGVGLSTINRWAQHPIQIDEER